MSKHRALEGFGFSRSRRVKVFFLAVVVVCAAVLVALALTQLRGSTAEAFTIQQPSPGELYGAGQQLIITDESVELQLVSLEASYNNEFGRWSPLPTAFFNCKDVQPGWTVAAGRYTGPLEIIFYLKTPTQPPDTWQSGPGSRNSDGFPHARMTQIASDTVRLEWEDLPNGGDHDYNDCVIDIIITKLASLTIQKDVVPNDSSLWDFTIDGPDSQGDRTINDLPDGGSQTETLLSAGSYTVTEDPQTGYTASFSGDCDSSGHVTLAGGDNKTCTITNTLNSAPFTVNKDFVPNSGASVTVSLSCPGATVSPTSANASEGASATFTVSGFSGNPNCTATESPVPPGYTSSGICGATLTAGSCTITNDEVAATLIVVKHVINDNGGTAVASNFTMTVTATNPNPASFPGAESPGTTVSLDAGSYSVGETGPSGYSTSYSNCSGSVAAGETKTCTVTNNDVQPGQPPLGVGGIVEVRGGTVDLSAQQSDSAVHDYSALAALAVAGGAIAVAAVALYARRRWLR
jgi:hypothetical protein